MWLCFDVFCCNLRTEGRPEGKVNNIHSEPDGVKHILWVHKYLFERKIVDDSEFCNAITQF